jgi:hypothetical protein
MRREIVQRCCRQDARRLPVRPPRRDRTRQRPSCTLPCRRHDRKKKRELQSDLLRAPISSITKGGDTYGQ